MAFTKINAAGIGTTETVTVDGLTVINDGSFGGNLSVGGTITYEDVTNVDSVGIITARAGVLVGSGITLSKDGDVFFTGIATGNGSGLTALNASNLASGTVPTARLGSGTASSSTFLRGDSTFAAVTSTTINNNADNRIITGSDTANTLNGEANLTFDGSKLSVTSSSKDLLYLNSTHSDGPQIPIQTSGTTFAYIGGAASLFSTGSSTDLGFRAESGKNFLFGIGGNEKVRIDSSGRLLIGTTTEGNATGDNLTISDSGNMGMTLRSTDSNYCNIYFSDAETGTAEYEGYISYNHNTNSLEFATGHTERLRIDSSGHMGLGVTPNSNWPSNDDFKALQLGTGACVFGRGSGDEDRGGISVNYYHTGSAEKYIGNGNASGILLNDGDIDFFTAGANSSGANAAMSKTISVRIDTGGGLNIGSLGGFDSNGDDLTITNSSHGGISIKTGTTSDGVIRFGDGSGANEYRGYINYRHDGDKFLIGTSGAQRLSVDSDGLKFGSDTASANALDDYEEGSWTPNDASGGGVTITSNGTGGTYTKIGRLVHVQYNITYGSTSNGNSAAIGNLPFSQDVQYGTGVVGWTSRDNPAGIVGHIGANHQIYFMDNTSASSNSGKHLENQELSGVQIIGNATYYAAT